MICVQQWRAAIGSWYTVTHKSFLNTFTHIKSHIFEYKNTELFIYLRVMYITITITVITMWRHTS